MKQKNGQFLVRHITIFPNYSDTEKDNDPLVFWHIAFKDKTETSMDEDLLLTSVYHTEEDFLKRVKEVGIKISNRTLYQYRNFFIFPKPYKKKVNGKETNFYNPEWIKYIKRIQDLKNESAVTS